MAGRTARISSIRRPFSRSTTCCSPRAPSSLPTPRRARTTTTSGDSSRSGWPLSASVPRWSGPLPSPWCRPAPHQDLPLLEVPYRTPFLTLARRIADARAEQDHARDLWALDALAATRRADRRRAGGAESTPRGRRAAARCPRRAAVRARSAAPRRCRDSGRAERGATAAAPPTAVRVVPRPAESARCCRAAGHHADARSPGRGSAVCSRWHRPSAPTPRPPR